MLRLILTLLFATPLAAAGKPNVIVFLADDTGWPDIGCTGAKDVATPNIDSIAKNGVRCTNGYVSCPYCSPTRAGLLTGRYQTRFGHEFNEGPNVDRELFGLPLEEKTLADRLKPLGYQCWGVGKWHLGYNAARRPMARGFDEYYGTLANSQFYKVQILDSRVSADPKPVTREDFYTTDAYGERAGELVRKASGKPFFLYLPFNANHVPVQVPQRYIDRFPKIENKERREYAAMMSAMDDAVGRVLTAVRETGQEKNTLVFFLADNGGPMTKGGANGSNNRPLKGQKMDTWEGGIRVPFLVQWPGKIPAGVVYEKPVISLDILPTAVTAAGGKVEAGWKIDGVELLPFLSGKNPAAPHDFLFWRFGTQMAVRKGDWKLVRGCDLSVPNPGPLEKTKTTTMLVNLAEDIGEEKDRSADKPEIAKELQAAWDKWNAEQLAPKWIPQPAKKKE